VIRVTPDTNILVSGLVYQRGKPYQLLRMALAGEINMTVSQAILDEMADVLARKFKMTETAIEEAKAIVTQAARVVTPAVKLQVVKEDPDDDKILECAVSGGSDYIVTGDKDLLRLKQYDSIRILKVADFMARGRSVS
jgi:putative PIN family toxin of toxin-antitoxin system